MVRSAKERFAMERMATRGFGVRESVDVRRYNLWFLGFMFLLSMRHLVVNPIFVLKSNFYWPFG